jgi:hypothetical protein
MKGPSSLGDRIEEIRLDLSLMEQTYDIAKRRMSGEDEEWNERREMLIRQIAELLGKYKIGDEPHKAVGIVAQASVMANELRMPEHWVAQYMEKQQLLKMAQADLNRMEEARKEAEEESKSQSWRRRAAVG